MKAYKADYLIIGGGLAGSTLGFLLRQAGKDVLMTELLDAKTKDKLCGGIVATTASEIFDTMYGAGEFATLEPQRCSGWILHCLNSRLTLSRQFPILPRKQLDDYCLGRYRGIGGKLLDRVRVSSIDATNRIATCLDLRTKESFAVTYNTLVGADGAMSSTRRMLTGRRARFVLTLEGMVPNIGDTMEFEVKLGKNGYCWYIPRKDDALVGCIYQRGHDQGRRDCLRDFCRRMRLDMPKLRAAPVPSGDDMLISAGEHAWLIGDAAGLADAIGGGGIHYALISAQMLADSLLGGKPYEQAMEPHLKQLQTVAENVDARYFSICLKAALKTKRAKEQPPRETD